MALKELITHRIQSGAKGRSWQVLMRTLEKDGILGLECLEPFQSVCCGALAGVISASLTMLLDVVKTRSMTQFDSEPSNKVDVAMVTGVLATVRQILKGERCTILDQYLKHKELETLVPAEAYMHPRNIVKGAEFTFSERRWRGGFNVINSLYALVVPASPARDFSSSILTLQDNFFYLGSVAITQTLNDSYLHQIGTAENAHRFLCSANNETINQVLIDWTKVMARSYNVLATTI
uniref:Uncharacterized protein n=1 Tax=Solanum lycopersicum TaxID=4081 RepID=A0A3Q7G7G4_SOLLC